MPCDQRQKGPSSRAHSAINEEAGSSIPRDRHPLLDIFSRPNTTHTYRVRCSSSSHNPAYTRHTVEVSEVVCLTHFFFSSRTLRTVVPSQCWTTLGRGGQAEPLWAQVRNSTKLKKKHTNAAGKWTGYTGVVVRLIPNWICNWIALAYTETHTCLVLLHTLCPCTIFVVHQLITHALIHSNRLSWNWCDWR